MIVFAKNNQLDKIKYLLSEVFKLNIDALSDNMNLVLNDDCIEIVAKTNNKITDKYLSKVLQDFYLLNHYFYTDTSEGKVTYVYSDDMNLVYTRDIKVIWNDLDNRGEYENLSEYALKWFGHLFAESRSKDKTHMTIIDDKNESDFDNIKLYYQDKSIDKIFKYQTNYKLGEAMYQVVFKDDAKLHYVLKKDNLYLFCEYQETLNENSKNHKSDFVCYKLDSKWNKIYDLTIEVIIDNNIEDILHMPFSDLILKLKNRNSASY
jgi:hypothetical protein